MPALFTDEKKGKKNKYLGIRIWSKYEDADPKDFFKDLKAFCIASMGKNADIKKLLSIHILAAEFLEALP